MQTCNFFQMSRFLTRWLHVCSLPFSGRVESHLLDILPGGPANPLPPSFLPVRQIHSLEPIACAHPQQCFSSCLLTSETLSLPDSDHHRCTQTCLLTVFFRRFCLCIPKRSLKKLCTETFNLLSKISIMFI